MWDYLIKSAIPRVVQDAVTAFAAYLATHGYITGDQTTGFIGSAFFLVMLLVNLIINQIRKHNAAIAGGAAVASAVPQDISLDDVRSIVKAAGAGK